jgi:hypothetical protein
MSAKITIIVYILICLEVGILLAILPWVPSYWDSNFFLDFLSSRFHLPGLSRIMQSGFVRGAVTGLGVLNVLAGVRDIFKFRESVQMLSDWDNSQKPSSTDSSPVI